MAKKEIKIIDIDKLVLKFKEKNGLMPNAVVISDNIIKQVAIDKIEYKHRDKIISMWGYPIIRAVEDDVLKLALI